ncbi:hypothetical protein [Klebsiella pneumoniae]
MLGGRVPPDLPQKYLAQLQVKQTHLQQELEQTFNLNQLHIELNQAPEQILQTLNELRQATQTAISLFDSENVRLTQAIKQHNQLIQTIQRNESLLNTAQQCERSSSSKLLANVNPTFSWVRIAQPVPVKIALDEAPKNELAFVSGRTATVHIIEK